MGGTIRRGERRWCGPKKRPKFFCINSVRRFFLLKCVQHTCVAFRSSLLMSNVGLLQYFPNRSFLFYFVSAYLCDQWDGEAEVQSMKAEFKCCVNRALKCFVYWVLSFTGFSSGTPATLVECPSHRHMLTVIYCMYNIRARLVHLYSRNVNN